MGIQANNGEYSEHLYKNTNINTNTLVRHVCMKARLKLKAKSKMAPNIAVFDNTPMILAVTREYNFIASLMTRKAKPIGSTRFQKTLVLILRYVKELFFDVYSKV